MQILITGAGMVGAHAARTLTEHGHRVTLFDVAPDVAYLDRVVGGGADVRRGDVRDLPALIEAVQSVGAEVVVHTAALIGNAAQEHPYRGVTVNVMGTVNVAEAARLGGARRVLHASTIGVNDLAQPQDGPLTEEFPIGSGGRIYGATKVACEQLLWAYSLAHGFELGLLRFAGIYGFGPFRGGSGIGPEILGLVRAAAEGRPGRLGSGMPERYEIVHVKDVARGIAAAATAPTLAHHVYNIGSGRLVTRGDVVAAMRSVVPTFTYDEDGDARPDRYPRRQPLDLSRSRAELGYEPQLELTDGLRDLLAEIAA